MDGYCEAEPATSVRGERPPRPFDVLWEATCAAELAARGSTRGAARADSPSPPSAFASKNAGDFAPEKSSRCTEMEWSLGTRLKPGEANLWQSDREVVAISDL